MRRKRPVVVVHSRGHRQCELALVVGRADTTSTTVSSGTDPSVPHTPLLHPLLHPLPPSALIHPGQYAALLQTLTSTRGELLGNNITTAHVDDQKTGLNLHMPFPSVRNHLISMFSECSQCMKGDFNHNTCYLLCSLYPLWYIANSILETHNYFVIYVSIVL